MSSESPAVRIPVIDFSKVKAGTAEWDTVKGQVRQALEEYGCFEAVLDEVLELRKLLLGAMEQFFELPLQTKERYASNKTFYGYCGALAPNRENVDVYDATTADNIQGLTNLMWPQGNSSFSKTLVCFTETASGLEKRIRRMILESFGLEKYMDELMDITRYRLRLMKYQRPAQSSDSEPNIPVHTDQGWVTLLYQINEVNGLEIQTKDGQWHRIKPSSPSSFIVMIGESLSVWLNGRLGALLHRVVVREEQTTRYSAGLFATPKGGYQVKTPQETVDQQNPLLFKPFDFEEFMAFYADHISQGGSLAESILKVYCAASSD